MMSFGWRPMLSCYASQAAQQAGATTGAGQAAEQTCPTANWFYVLLAAAAITGLAKGSK